MPLDRREVEHLASLARLGLSDEEVAALQQQLAHILEQFEILREVDTSNVASTGHAVDLQTVLREDTAGQSLPPEETLSNAPRRAGAFFQVKAVLEE